MTAEDDLLSGQVDKDRPLDMTFPGARAGEKPSPPPCVSTRDDDTLRKIEQLGVDR